MVGSGSLAEEGGSWMHGQALPSPGGVLGKVWRCWKGFWIKIW